jgi:RNA recognition motif-containing protein
MEALMQKLFIGNIPHASSETEVRQWIESQGFRVESVEIIYDRQTGKPRGFGFARLPDESDVESAIALLNGRRMDGRVLTVNKATPLTGRSAEAQVSIRSR